MSVQESTSGSHGSTPSGATLGRKSLLPTAHRPLPTAFTLIELLVVMAIITVVVALGIPLFGALTGAKSVEAGRNIVAATIGAARTAAVNEGKYAGVIFYMDPATERTAMTVVIVSDPISGLEDPDPYDKYKGWVSGQEYKSPEVDSNGVPQRGDRVIALTSDADASFKGALYTPVGSNNATTSSAYLQWFGNYRPTVRVFRCTQAHPAQNTKGIRPPQNGPYPSPPAITQTLPSYAQTTFPIAKAESSLQGFANSYWNAELDKGITRYNTGQQTLLPPGIGLQVITNGLALGLGQERYLRTGVIMFDPQGRLVQRAFSLDLKDTLGEYLQLTASAPNILSGVGIVLYDENQFRADASRSQADAVYQIGIYKITSNGTAFNDYKTDASELAEEKWLDNNTTPLLINRYSGSMSETE